MYSCSVGMVIPEEIDEMALNSKIFNDAVHGSIEVHPLAVKIIDTPQFQRLRFIKQVGSVYFVYPSASHNRFEHSLGVYHLAGLLAKSLRERQPDLQITDTDILCVEIAGLCHDLGHGPFSHLWGNFISKKRPELKWKHEDSSVKMFDHLIKANHLEDEIKKYHLEEEDLTFIKEIIAIPPNFAEDAELTWPYKGRPVEKSFLYQIVANRTNGVDVDKWDYILRDGQILGLQVTFNCCRLMKFSRVIKNDKSPHFSSQEICYRDKEVRNLYDMFHARMMLHRKAYQHKVVKTLDIMFVDAFMLANDHITYRGANRKELPLCDVIDDPEAMTYLNDDIIHQIHRSSSTDKDMKHARQIIDDVLTRRCYPYVGSSFPTTREWTMEDVIEEMKKEPDLKTLLDKENPDLKIHLISLDYSQEKENPVSKVGFFTKEEPNVYKEHVLAKTSKLFPPQWGEKIIFAVCRNYNENLLAKAREAFSRLFH